MNYYIADTHFGHNAILRFDQRPFDDLQQMEETIIANWNAVVKPGDTVYILGDFCWGKTDEWLRIIRKLKGNKVAKSSCVFRQVGQRGAIRRFQ